MAMIGKVRRMRFRQEKSVREISRATSLSRNTVRKYLRIEQVEESRYERKVRPTKLTAYHEQIVAALKADSKRLKREQRTAKAYVPLTFELGEAYQFDWSDEALVIAAVYRKVQLAHMKLCASRAFWLAAYPSQGHEMLFDAHGRCFAALGIARRGTGRQAASRPRRLGGDRHECAPFFGCYIFDSNISIFGVGQRHF